MKISTLEKNGISPEVMETISLLLDRIPWPSRRQAMAEVTTILLDGKPRVAEDVFGWSRVTVSLGMNELRTGIICNSDLSRRRKPKTEEKYPKLLIDIRELMEPECQADPHLRTTLAYTDKTAAFSPQSFSCKRLVRGDTAFCSHYVRHFDAPWV